MKLADALAKNCGILLQQQLASERFMDALGWLVDDEVFYYPGTVLTVGNR